MSKEKDDLPLRSGIPAGIKESLKKAVTEMMILFLLRQKPMHTNEVMHEVERLSDGVLSFTTLYMAIYRLARFGYLVESGRVRSDDNRVRIYFSVTECGEKHLEQMIAEYRLITDSVDRILSQDGKIYQETDQDGEKA